ncbi:MAG: tetratricopeptide repeat protein [Chloroflexi bacterium]|nr:tetratricopeptide repeat protein [Chloroflexota bacterium]
MTEAAHHIEDGEYEDNFVVEDELPTNRLSTGNLELLRPVTPAASEQEEDEIDWLARLTTQPTSPEILDERPEPQPEPSGMGQHAAAPRMAPTFGSKLRIGLRKGILLAIFSLLAAGVLIGGSYALASTSWLSSLFAGQSAEQAPQGTDPAGNQSSQPGPQQNQQYAQGQPTELPASASGDAKTLRDKGVAEYKAGRYDAAIKLLESATTIDESDAITYYQLGLAYMAATERAHALDDAEMAFRSASALQPDWAAPDQMLAESMIRRGFYKQAIDPALSATKLDPQLGEAWMTLGRAYQGAGQQAEATQAFAQAARYAPPPPQLQP